MEELNASTRGKRAPTGLEVEVPVVVGDQLTARVATRKGVHVHHVARVEVIAGTAIERQGSIDGQGASAVPRSKDAVVAFKYNPVLDVQGQGAPEAGTILKIGIVKTHRATAVQAAAGGRVVRVEVHVAGARVADDRRAVHVDRRSTTVAVLASRLQSVGQHVAIEGEVAPVLHVNVPICGVAVRRTDPGVAIDHHVGLVPDVVPFTSGDVAAHCDAPVIRLKPVANLQAASDRGALGITTRPIVFQIEEVRLGIASDDQFATFAELNVVIRSTIIPRISAIVLVARPQVTQNLQRATIVNAHLFAVCRKQSRIPVSLQPSVPALFKATDVRQVPRHYRLVAGGVRIVEYPNGLVIILVINVVRKGHDPVRCARPKHQVPTAETAFAIPFDRRSTIERHTEVSPTSREPAAIIFPANHPSIVADVQAQSATGLKDCSLIVVIGVICLQINATRSKVRAVCSHIQRTAADILATRKSAIVATQDQCARPLLV